MREPPILSLEEIILSLGDKTLLKGVNLHLYPGDKVCLVGRNGAGKSTLMKIIAGTREVDSGKRFVKPGTHIHYLPQEPDVSQYTSLTEYIATGLPADQKEDTYLIESACHDVGLDLNLSIKNLSGGELRRATVARALVSDADLYLFDEPTNHLDIAAVEWLEGFLKSWRKAFVIISHDRMFLEHLTDKTLWLDRGTVRTLNKGFSHYEDWYDECVAQEIREQERFDKKLQQELEWRHKGVTARRKRNQRRMKNLDTLRQEKKERVSIKGDVRLKVEAGDMSSKMVVEVKNAGHQFGERTLFSQFSTRILRGDKIGFIGPNGAGKSTLIKILTGELQPASGKVRIGRNLTPVYIDQKRELLDPKKRVMDILCEDGKDHLVVHGVLRHVISYLKDFLFEASQVRSPVGALSGGERNRLLLAKGLANPSNLLILDEPTNDLDMETLDLLQELLNDYDGTLLLVSHDRHFLDHVVTSSFVFEEGQVTEYAGGYSDYKAQKQKAVVITPEAKGKTRKNDPQEEKTKPKQTQNRLSYKYKRMLDEIPDKLEVLDKEIAALEQVLNDPKLYAQNPEQFQSSSLSLVEKQKEYEKLEEQLLEIEIMQEELESNSQ